MNLRMLLFPAIMLASLGGAEAQQRKCDMAIDLIEPAPGAVINAYAQYNLRVNIKNNGPDTLFVGDTLYYNKPTQPLFTYNPYILAQPINPGDNITVTLETLHNVNSDETDQVMDYYVFVESNLNDNGRFIDTTNDDNNYDVNANVTFRAGNPTGIGDLDGSKTSLTLYPNPATHDITLKPADADRIRFARITDISGREVTRQEFTTAGAQAMDISSLSPGMYLVQLETEKGKLTGKFIKK